ncbi:MAG: hypothetical protein U5J83_01425 [Bryobacterales bacterium]|nr:hypothetical protein [Bryobacterales bacterium]
MGEDLSEYIKKKVKEETVVSDLTYDLRSGEPDFIDKMVATTFGNMALVAIHQGKSGLMTPAILGGKYAMVGSESPGRPARRRTRHHGQHGTAAANYADKVGLPIFLVLA